MPQELKNRLTEMELDIVWCHWNRLGAMGYGRKNQCSTDPEALLLLTAMVGSEDLRLVEIMKEWLERYESLVSIERLKRYIKELRVGDVGRGDVFCSLQEVVSKLGIKRWESVVRLLKNDGVIIFSMGRKRDLQKKLESHDKIIQNNLQLFLRLMFGVGTRADIIYYATIVFDQEKNPFNLLISAPNISSSLHYNNSSIHRTLCDLEQAGVLLEDTRKKVGKNKIYISKTDFGSKMVSRDKCYVDWFGIVKLFILIEQLKEQIRDIRDESIIKSRLNDFLRAGSELINRSYIDIKNTLSEQAFRPALKRIGLNELESSVVSLLSGTHEFITGKAWS